MAKAPTLKRIKLTQIQENPSAIRNVNRQNAQYLEMVDSVKSRGVINPVSVRELKGPDGGVIYGLIDGLHRYTSSLDAGLTDIPAQVIDADEADAMEIQLIGNIMKIDTKPVEYSRHLQKILACNPMLSITSLAGKLNKSTTWLSERLKLTELSAPIAKLVDEGKINLSNSFMLAKLPEEEQVAFTDRAMTMSPSEFVPTILARKKEIDIAKRKGRAPSDGSFVPVAHIQKLNTLKDELANGAIRKVLCNGLTSAEAGFEMGIKWTLHLDPESVKIAEEADKVRKLKLDDERKRAAAERARLRSEEAAQSVATLEHQTV